MFDQFSNLQVIRKPAVRSKGGVVAAQSRRAAKIGAEVLAAGGDCVDATIATGFALGVLEPWMSEIGGGAMVLAWERFIRLVERFFPPIKTLDPLPCHRFDATTQGRSPVRWQRSLGSGRGRGAILVAGVGHCVSSERPAETTSTSLACAPTRDRIAS